MNQPIKQEMALHKYFTSPKRVPTEGVASYDINLKHVKTRSPVYSQAKDKRHIHYE